MQLPSPTLALPDRRHYDTTAAQRPAAATLPSGKLSNPYFLTDSLVEFKLLLLKNEDFFFR
jgi:hypothetical protein